MNVFWKAKTQLFKWDDIQTHCIISHDRGEFFRIHFEVFQVAHYLGTDQSGIYGDHNKPEYPIKGGQGFGDVTSNINEAEIFMSGGIKFDGCMDLGFNEIENAQDTIHFCGYKYSAEKIGIIIKRLYEIAESKMPGCEPELAKQTEQDDE